MGTMGGNVSNLGNVMVQVTLITMCSVILIYVAAVGV